MVSVDVEVVPVKVNSFTAVILLKKGTIVRRTKRRSLETRRHGHEGALGEDHDHRLLGGGEVADHGDDADHERRLRGVGDEGRWPLKSVTLGAWRTLLRVSPWAALMKK